VPTDAELIGWSLGGDRNAFVEVTQRHAGAVWGYLVRRAGREAAGDLLGDVWTEAFASRGRYDRSYPDAGPWLFGVAANILRRHWRRATHQPNCVPCDPTPEPSVDPWDGIDDLLDGASLLRAALSRLRRSERDVLCLVVWEQLSVAEAARSLGVPPGTARRHLHDARVRLRGDPAILAVLTALSGVKEPT